MVSTDEIVLHGDCDITVVGYRKASFCRLLASYSWKPSISHVALIKRTFPLFQLEGRTLR